MGRCEPGAELFRSIKDVEDFSALASRVPSKEASFRWLFLNQRIDASAPFVAPAIWRACDGSVDDSDGLPIFGGLDLSEVSDLTSLVLMAPKETDAGTIGHVRPTFWLPGDALRDKGEGRPRSI